jgi:NAD(P)-dependent dehydrogenase (short-subunit alcohol dehydrogenase family)
MQIDLSGKRAIVTGSTSGIGFAIASGLAETGAAVVINGRSEKSVQAAKARFIEKQPKAKVEAVAGDLSSAEGVAAFIARAGDADILVNNIGIFEPKPFAEIPDSDWQHFFDVNVMSGVRLSRHYLPAMMKRDWGRIVFISSESAINIPVEMVHYGATKTAQLGLALGLAVTAAGTGVTVNSVLPGPTSSEGVVDFLGKLGAGQNASQKEIEAKFIAEDRPTSIIRRMSTPEEIANMVVYVCSKQASATTGAALRVDGGVVRSVV